MKDDRYIRLECLRLAEASRARGDQRNVLDIAGELYGWIQSGRVKTQPPDLSVADDMPLLSLAVQRGRPRTIKEMILALLLEVGPKGLTAQEILNGIQIRWFPSLQRTSLSPQLSRLKNDDRKIFLERGVYKLRKTNASSEDQSDEAQEK